MLGDAGRDGWFSLASWEMAAYNWIPAFLRRSTHHFVTSSVSSESNMKTSKATKGPKAFSMTISCWKEALFLNLKCFSFHGSWKSLPFAAKLTRAELKKLPLAASWRRSRWWKLQKHQVRTKNKKIHQNTDGWSTMSTIFDRNHWRKGSRNVNVLNEEKGRQVARCYGVAMLSGSASKDSMSIFSAGAASWSILNEGARFA